MMSYAGGTAQLTNGSVPFMTNPSSPPIINISDAGFVQDLPPGNTLPPEVIYMPNNQPVTYKQNIMVRWLKPPTPPPLAPIIIRG